MASILNRYDVASEHEQRIGKVNAVFTQVDQPFMIIPLELHLQL